MMLSRSDHQIGTLTITTSATLAKAATCGRAQNGRADAGLAGTAGGGAAPAGASNRRRASAIAASRRAGRGGGGSGNSAERSLSIPIYLPRRPLPPRATGRCQNCTRRALRDYRDRHYTPTGGWSNADRRDYSPSRAIAEAVRAARTIWTNSER